MASLFEKWSNRRRKSEKETALKIDKSIESQPEVVPPLTKHAKTYQGLISYLTAALISHYTSDGDKEKNLVFSPYSILTLLYMAADATGGTTREEILSAAADGLELDQVRLMQETLAEALTKSEDLLCANAVCVREDLKDTIRPAYPDSLRKFFSGELFSSADIVREVNAWVREKTKEMIDGILDEKMGNIMFCLVNAIAFQAEWAEPYEQYKISDETFTNANGSEVIAPMLHSMEDWYVEDDSFTGFIKPYKDGRYSFMALLPKQESYFSLLQAAKSIDFSKLDETRSECDVRVFMPEFQCDFSDDLRSFCNALGIRKTFTDEADFSPLTTYPAKADAIIHKAHIEVDRHGTKAAAATAVGMAPMSMFIEPRERKQKTVHLNRPFVYAVIHNETGIPVFTGITKQIPGSCNNKYFPTGILNRQEMAEGLNMRKSHRIKYDIDLVFCIDATEGMDHFISILHDNARNLHQDIKRCMEERMKYLGALRVRFIVFRDYCADSEDAMLYSKFFELPEEAENFHKCVNCLAAGGGGDARENGLEALAYAIRSKWSTDGIKRRHVIVLLTDNEAHELGFGKNSGCYPRGMAKNIEELTAWWGSDSHPGYMNQEAKRLILFAPETPNWRQISDYWDKVIHFPSEAGGGLRELEYKKIISIIVQSK